MEKRPALGKGLSALIPDAPEPARASPVEADVDRLTPNEFQPRAQVDDARLQELAQSIKANGVIQPIVVRRVGDRFQIIAGERRWRAAKLAGLLRVPIAVPEVASGRLSMGHARSLLSLTDEADQRRMARDVIARSLSVRETESLVKKIVEGGAPAREALVQAPADVHTRAAEDRLKLLLGTRVRIVRHGTRG